jgi:nucleotide-binding universal stress UspA family protein
MILGMADIFQRVFIPLDGSPAAASVIDQLLPLFQRTGGEVVLARAVQATGTGLEDYPGVMGSDPAVAAEEAETFIDREVSVLKTLGLNARGVVLRGPAGVALLEGAKDEKATLIAMATHGRSGIARWALGSIAEKVLRACEQPLMLVRSFRPGGEVVDEREEAFPRHILFPVDGSDRALEPAPVIQQLAGMHGAAVSVLHFVSDYEGEEGMKVGAEQLERASATLSALGLRPETHLLRGDPAKGIVERGGLGGLLVNEVPVDLIVMSSHGRSGMSRWVLGSVTEKVLRHVGVPMLIMKSQSD